MGGERRGRLGFKQPPPSQPQVTSDGYCATLQLFNTRELLNSPRALRLSFSNEAVKKENGRRRNLVHTLAANYLYEFS